MYTDRDQTKFTSRTDIWRQGLNESAPPRPWFHEKKPRNYYYLGSLSIRLLWSEMLLQQSLSITFVSSSCAHIELMAL